MEKHQIYYDQIKNLLAEKKFKEAIKIFDSLNKISPFDKRTIKAKKMLYESIENENKDKIEKTISRANEKMGQKDYETALKILRPFANIAPNHKRLLKTIKEAQKLYKEQIKIAQEIFEEREAKNFTKSMNLNTQDFLKEIITFKRKHEENPLANTFLEKSKIYYIHNKIERNKELIISKKYDLIEKFIADLKTISESNQELINLEKKIKQEKYDNQVFNLKESIYEAERNIETLIKLKKFEKAYKGSKELLNSDPRNKIALEYLKKAKIGINIDNSYKARILITENLENLKKEYLQNPSAFKKL